MSSRSKYFFAKKSGSKKKTEGESSRPQKSIASFFGKKKSGQDEEDEKPSQSPSKKRKLDSQKKEEEDPNDEEKETKIPKLEPELSANSKQKLERFNAHSDHVVQEKELKLLSAVSDQGDNEYGISSPEKGKDKDKDATSGMKPTPLEQQVIDFKKKYPKLLLFVECGYR